MDQPELFRQVRSGEAVLAANDWQSAYRERLQHAIRPSLAPRQAAE